MLQRQALAVLKRGDSVFLTGPAGSGKTYVLRQFIDAVKKQKKSVAVTASTGIAATHIGGTTIHSWSGLGIRDRLSDHDKIWLSNNTRLIKRYNATDILVIDEVSMLHGARLDMVNEVCKLLRRSDQPFGGMQVILTGDLFQLPPVNRSTSPNGERLNTPDDFMHASTAWQELNPRICYLSEQHRQRGDELLTVLEAMRLGRLEPVHQTHLTSRIGIEPPTGLALTRLYAHNVDVEAVNQGELSALPGESEIYRMEVGGRKAYVDQLKSGVLAPETLELKRGAEVMFVANNFTEKFVNGTRGRVIDFKYDYPVVELQTTKRQIVVEPHTWTVEEEGRPRAQISQLPLRLAWAITIHKSQGMSLDSALIDLSRSFTYGMGYVALSRVRRLDGLFLLGLNRMSLQLHPAIFAFDRELRQESEQLAAEIGEVIEPTETEAVTETVVVDPTLYKILSEWRLKQATSQQLPAYIIAHNKTLEAIATRRPQDEQQLLSVRGVGQRFVEQYGAEVLAMLKLYTTSPLASLQEVAATHIK